MNTDTTYCSRDCANISCVRNKKHIHEGSEHIWFCDFWWSNFKDCEWYKDEQNNDN